MKNYKPILLLTAALSLYACRINGSFQGLYGYYDKSKKENPDLFITPGPDETVCELKNQGDVRIYVINGNDLKNCLKNKKKKVIVYLWGPNCKSKFCYPLNIMQEMCNKNDIEPYVVAEYYDLEQMEQEQHTANPIFGINTTYYGSNLTSVYVERFINDLADSDINDSKFLYIKNGVFQNSYGTMEMAICDIDN